MAGAANSSGQGGADNDEHLCVDLSGHRCTDLAGVQASDATRAVAAFLHNNHLSLWADFIHFQSALRILDLRHNLFIALPAGSFWDSLSNLQILCMDGNAITSVASLASLAPLRALISVSFAHNPVAVKTGYRQELINSLPHLAMIDDYLISDQERLRQRNLGPLLIPVSSRFLFPRFSTPASTSDHRGLSVPALLESYLGLLRAVEERLSPVRVLQRWWRTLKERQKQLEEKMAQMTGRLHRQQSYHDMRRRLSRQQSRASFDSAALTRMSSTIIDDDDEDDPEGDIDDKDGDGLTIRATGDPEYDLRLRQRRAEIHQELNTIVLIGGDPSGGFARLVQHARAMLRTPGEPESAAADMSLTPLNVFSVPAPGTGYGFGQRHRSLAQAVANRRAFGPREPPLTIHRRLCHPSSGERRAFDQGWNNGPQITDERRVYVFRAPNTEFRETLLRLVASHNLEASRRGHPIIDVHLYHHVLECLSACRLQCLWRGWRTRHQLAADLYVRRRRRRAGHCLARAWRSYLMRLRFRMLSDAHRICHAIQTPFMFLSRPALDLLLTVPNPFRRLRLFPEHRVRFSVDEDGRVLFRTAQAEYRPVPGWLGVGGGGDDLSLVIDEDEVDAALDTDQEQLLGSIRDLTRYHTSFELKVVSRADDDWSLSSSASLSDPEPLWLLEFPTIFHARLRAYLILIHTWEPITQSFGHARPARRDSATQIWSVIGAETPPPSAYRDLPRAIRADFDEGADAVGALVPVYRSQLNLDGIDDLLHHIDRELIEVDPEIAEQHGISDQQLQDLVHLYGAVDDLVEPAAFLLKNDGEHSDVCHHQDDDDSDDSADVYHQQEVPIDDDGVRDPERDARMRWQCHHLELEAFGPHREPCRDRADIDLRRRLAMADAVRQESQHLSMASQRERDQSLDMKKKSAQTQRDLHHIRLNLNKIRPAPIHDDNCKDQIASQRRQRFEQARSMTQRIRMRKRQFQKDQMIERRITQVRRHTERLNQAEAMTETRAVAEGIERARVAELQAVAQTARAMRSNRARIHRDGLHFHRQLCQIGKQIRSAQAKEANSLRAALTARDVQMRKIRDARLRQTVHDRLLIEFNRRRQNAIAQQMRIRQETEQRRHQEHQVQNQARADRRQMRQIRDRIAEELATCRELLRLDVATADEYYDDVAASFMMGNDQATTGDNLTSQLHDLEQLANHVRLACSRAFHSA